MIDFNEIAIIGMGLMGGSVALRLKKLGYKGTIVASGSRPQTLAAALESKAVDRIESDLKKAVATADLVIVAAPVGYTGDIFKEIADTLKKGAIVTDVGSVKGYVLEMAKKFLPNAVVFLGGHPMAGSEKSGFSAATPYLYENAYYFITPTAETPIEAVDKLTNLIEQLGAYPVVTDPYEHDKLVAQISHLPQLMATALVNMLDEKDKGISYMPFAGGGFRDTTRIASSSPEMWRDIFTYNKKEVLNCVTQLEKSLNNFKEVLFEGNQGENI